MIDKLIAKGFIPTFLLRLAIRALLYKRLRKEKSGGIEAQTARKQLLIEKLSQSALAVEVEKANEQHYEVPDEFYRLTLGKNLKYSSALWKPGTSSLSDAEEEMLSIYCERAEIRDGMDILELGCGWGSLSLWLAKHFPNSRITGISNSGSQREFISKEAAARNLSNLEIITCDINKFSTEKQFDRIVSIEMFEHLRNYRELLKKISGWLKEDGKLFVHIFAHREVAYLFEAESRADWMAKYFFSGGIMPSDDLLLHFQEHMKLERHWVVNGRNYGKTAEAWRLNLEKDTARSLEVLSRIYGQNRAELWYSRWKLFFLACEELFGFKRGEEWIVSHYLFTNTR